MTETYYDNLGARYIEPSDPYLSKYHALRLDTAEELLRRHVEAGRLFDFGCGSGELIERINGAGYQVEASDLSSEMSRLTAERTGVTPTVGGLEVWRAAKGPFSGVVALNVLPYLSEAEEREFFALAREKATTVLVSHTNALFDLVTFNRYTVEFWRDNLLPLMGGDQAALLESFKALLTHPEKPPAAAGLKSERDFLAKRRVDPFTYPAEIEALGFRIVELRFINAFPVPPLIAQADPALRLRHLETHDRLPDTLRRIFCSQFQLLARRA